MSVRFFTRDVTSFGQAIPDKEKPAKELAYADSPYAPDWARAPSERPPKPEPPPEPEKPPNELSRLEVGFLKDVLWRQVDDDVRLYALIDGGWCHGLYGRLLNSGLSWCNLFQGQAAQENQLDSPYLVALDREHPFTDWLLSEGWGKGWGIYLLASSRLARELYKAPEAPKLAAMRQRGHFIAAPGIEEAQDDPLLLLRQHLRRFTEVEFEDDGRVVLFRFYDPAVLRTYLPTCNPAELAGFFGPVQTFLVEGYCEIETLNKPYEIYAFAQGLDKQSRSAFEFVRFDGLTGKAHAFNPMPCAGERAERKPGPHVLIRHGQIATFAQVQDIIFSERLTVMLARLAASLGHVVPFAEIRGFTDAQIAKARGHGLSTEIEITAYANCAAALGSDFDEGQPAASWLAQHRNEPRWEIAERLEGLVAERRKGLTHGG